VTSCALSSPRRGCASATAAKSGRLRRNFSSHFALIFGRPRFVILHALANRDVVTTFCVTATV
jgi:hypothetical protein